MRVVLRQVSGDRPEPVYVLVQEEGMSHKPSLLLDFRRRHPSLLVAAYRGTARGVPRSTKMAELAAHSDRAGTCSHRYAHGRRSTRSSIASPASSMRLDAWNERAQCVGAEWPTGKPSIEFSGRSTTPSATLLDRFVQRLRRGATASSSTSSCSVRDNCATRSGASSPTFGKTAAKSCRD